MMIAAAFIAGLVIGLLFKEHLIRCDLRAAAVCLDCVQHRPCASRDREQPRDWQAIGNDVDPQRVPQC